MVILAHHSSQEHLNLRPDGTAEYSPTETFDLGHIFDRIVLHEATVP